MGIRIYLAGRVALELDGKVVIGERELRGRRGRLVFAYLVCERTRPVLREDLAKALWSEKLAPSWEGALSALMSRLRSLLSAGPLAASDVSLSSGFGQYRIRLPTDVWVDMEASVSGVDRAEAAIRAGDPGQVLGPAAVATAIARRPFLSGVSGEWAESQRRRLERQLVRALDCLTQMRLSLGDPVLALESAIEAVAVDPFRERAHQFVMRSHAAGGNRAKAVGAYHRLRELLADELATEPSPETEALYLKLLD